MKLKSTLKYNISGHVSQEDFVFPCLCETIGVPLHKNYREWWIQSQNFTYLIINNKGGGDPILPGVRVGVHTPSPWADAGTGTGSTPPRLMVVRGPLSSPGRENPYLRG